MSKQPPIPRANRSDKGPGEPSHPATDDHKAKPNERPDNTASQGHQGNTKINTTHQGYQQDR
ncbi:hypothetical protein ASE66_29240 [Bosea sp. Root483D1]|uniref:hypothetical protein n=1 Tax=Bosea sp. Root483D1 TaxID=1736544 RepID=UPI00070F6057|nr:hypothetical protein [Bosea sp. Root483D1]KRE17554.1 hypothetical protein ASE66_29240 [Bosea sp. Root483D1]